MALSVALAEGGELTGARLFTGAGHARLLLIYAGDAPEVRTRALPAIGQNPARGIILLDGMAVGDIQGSTVGEDGVLDMEVVTVQDSAQVSLTFEQSRRVRASSLMDGAILIDMIAEGRGEDTELPDANQLRAWLEGVSFAPRELDAPRGRRLIVVDAGHGGWDHGAVGYTGSREADIALQIARRVARGLEDVLGAEVIMTRDEDVFVTLRERAAIANQNGADLFLSVHANAAPGKAAWGIETYSMDTASDAGAARVARRENVLSQESGEDEESLLRGKLLSDGTDRLSRTLSAEIQQTVIAQLSERYGASQVRDLGAKTALFYVLVSTRMPAVLFEASFVSNPDDERKLRTPHFQQAMADAIVEAVKSWTESNQ
jgi:N-acetylmuramoyl-L-alanine amidase